MQQNSTVDDEVVVKDDEDDIEDDRWYTVAVDVNVAGSFSELTFTYKSITLQRIFINWVIRIGILISFCLVMPHIYIVQTIFFRKG